MPRVRACLCVSEARPFRKRGGLLPQALAKPLPSEGKPVLEEEGTSCGRGDSMGKGDARALSTAVSLPECEGALWRFVHNFRCRKGRSFSHDMMLRNFKRQAFNDRQFVYR